MQDVYDFLAQHGIPHEVHEHPAVFTVAEAEKVRIDVDFGENKNLFLRNKKGTKHYLVTLAAKKKLDLRGLAEQLGENGLGFASEDRLMKYLGLTKGSVSPFGLINDEEHEVTYVIDKDLLEYENLGFHPNINTRTVVLRTTDFQTFLEEIGNPIIELNL